MALTERLALLVSLDSQGAIRGFEKIGKSADRNLSRAESKIDRTAQRMQKAGIGMLGAATLAATGLYKAGQSAADLEQAVGGTEAVFKDASGTIDKFASNSASKMGLSERAFREATTSIGGQLKGLGFSTDDAADRAVELTGVAADLAATYGGTTAEAVQALGAAFRGEADPAERFNLRLNQNTVNAKAVAMGLAESTSQVDAQAKAQATLALITEQSADAQGQFAREAGSASGQMQIANAEFENAKAALGQSVAPIIADVAGGLASVAGGFQSVNQASGGFLSTVATVGTVGLAAGGGLSYMVGKVTEMRDTLGPLTSKLYTAEGGLTKLGKAGIVAGAALALVALNKMGDDMNDLEVDVDALSVALGDLTDAGNEELERFVTAAIAMGEFDEAVKQTADTNVIAAERLIDYAEAAGLAAGEVEKLRGITDDKRAADKQGAEDQATYAKEVQNTADASADAAGETSGLAAEIETLSDTLRAQFDPLFGAQDALLDLQEAQQAVTDAVAEFGPKSDEAVEANRRAVEAAFNYESALSNLETAVADGSVSIDDAKLSLQRWADQGYITKQAADETLWSFGVLKGKADALDGTNARVKVTADVDQAFLELERLARRLNALPGRLRVSVDGGGGLTLASGGLVPQYFAGGGGPRGSDTTPAWLTPGEFVMKRSAVDRIGVGMLSALNAGLAPGGGAGTIVIPVSIGGREVERLIVDTQARTVRRGFAA